MLGLELPEDDRFYDDKADILELAGLAEASSFQLRVDAEPPSQLLAFLRLVNLAGTRGLYACMHAGGGDGQRMRCPGAQRASLLSNVVTRSITPNYLAAAQQKSSPARGP